MSHESDHGNHSPKKLKKLHQLLKNRHTRDINQQAEQHERSRDLEKEREEQVKAAGLASSRSAAQKNKAGNADTWRKLETIRSRNSHQARVVQDRWNRFAGTETGGGRGL